MTPILETLGQQAIRPVVERVDGIRRLILVPNRALHIFPLHACPLGDGRLVNDAFEVVTTPSLSILHRCAERSRPRPDRLLTVENPTGDLRFTESESAVIRPFFAGQERRWRADARREWLWLRDGIKTGRQLVEEVATDAFLDHVTDPARRERCRRQRDHLARACPDTQPFAGLADWATFTAVGLAYPHPGPTGPHRTTDYSG